VGQPAAADHRRRRQRGARQAARPNIAACLKSKRRIPFNETGIFRRYPALDK
jgi:hypothetical protein